MKSKSYSKLVAIFALVLAMATSLWFASPSTLCYAQGGYGVGGGPVYTPPPGLTSLIGKITGNGVLTVDVIVQSHDRVVQLTIDKGTTALDKWGRPLYTIMVVELTTPPTPPDYVRVGSAYECGPSGATFEPAIAMTFTYEAADIPTGVSEEDLVLAYWDGDTWVMLTTTVNTVANTVTADVAHFTTFAIIAPAAPPLPAPAAFVTTDLSITPAEVNIGEEVTISILVTNTGGLTGSYEVTLKVDEVLVTTEEVTLDGGTSQTVTFTTAKDVAGTYAVTVADLSGTFVVTEVAPPPIKWWLLGGIIAGFIILCLIIWRVVARRKA